MLQHVLRHQLWKGEEVLGDVDTVARWRCVDVSISAKMGEIEGWGFGMLTMFQTDVHPMTGRCWAVSRLPLDSRSSLCARD